MKEGVRGRRIAMGSYSSYGRRLGSTCLRLTGRKPLVALIREASSRKRIHSMDAEDDVMAAMARELVEKGRVGESADAVAAS
jgi:hypothetical protein